MLTDETAKLLIEALNRMSAAIERVAGANTLGGGVHIYHHNCPTPGVYPLQPPAYPLGPTWGVAGSYGSAEGNGG